MYIHICIYAYTKVYVGYTYTLYVRYACAHTYSHIHIAWWWWRRLPTTSVLVRCVRSLAGSLAGWLACCAMCAVQQMREYFVVRLSVVVAVVVAVVVVDVDDVVAVFCAAAAHIENHMREGTRAGRACVRAFQTFSIQHTMLDGRHTQRLYKIHTHTRQHKTHMHSVGHRTLAARGPFSPIHNTQTHIHIRLFYALAACR